jgi:hypothetical protein
VVLRGSPPMVLLNQRKYVSELLRSVAVLVYLSVASLVSTPMSSSHDGRPLTSQESTRYCNTIGGLQYLTMTRPNLSCC